MINTFRDCPGCRLPREFAQIHPGPERCPDVRDGVCPEWFCTSCGAGLLLDLPLAVLANTGAGSLDRVA